jgi:CubicO group peptidase (beta-lactamase class C family)
MNAIDTSAARVSVTALLDKIRDNVGIPGIGVVMSSAGNRIEVCSGEADKNRAWHLTRNSRFGIGCITKLLVASVAVLLHKQNALSLDSPIQSWLEEETSGGSISGKITLRNLLSHTGGFQGPLIIGTRPSAFNWKEFRTGLGGCQQIFEPGTVFNYEHLGHVIVGEIISRMTGRETIDLVQKMIFEPLGIIPGIPFKDYNQSDRYVSPHQNLDGKFVASVSPPFGRFWRASLADLSLTLNDFVTIGEALSGERPEVNLAEARDEMFAPTIELPVTVSGMRREHAPRFFGSVCSEFASGWFGYNGSTPGTTCCLRFCLESGVVCAVGLNAWLPVVRDHLIDQLCSTRSHPNAGQPGGNPGFSRNELAGHYVGGGNIIRSANISIDGSRLTCVLGDDGLSGPPMNFELNAKGELVPDPESIIPGVGFFAEQGAGAPCLMIGVTALKRV